MLLLPVSHRLLSLISFPWLIAWSVHTVGNLICTSHAIIAAAGFNCIYDFRGITKTGPKVVLMSNFWHFTRAALRAKGEKIRIWPFNEDHPRAKGMGDAPPPPPDYTPGFPERRYAAMLLYGNHHSENSWVRKHSDINIHRRHG